MTPALFTVVYDVGIATDKLNRDLDLMCNWAHQWKMQFNPDKTNMPYRLSFPRKQDAVIHPPVFFSGSKVAVKTEHKHLGMILDSVFKVISGKQ